MEPIVELSWRIYPAIAMLVGGSVLALFGAERGFRGIWLPIRDPSKNLTIITGFRLTVIGLAIAGIAGAWAWGILWLLVLSLAIGGEETLESSIHAYALRRGRRLQEEAETASCRARLSRVSIRGSRSRTMRRDMVDTATDPSTSVGMTALLK